MRRFIIILLVIGSLTACEEMFQYSPYDANVSEYNLNEKNIQRISSVNPDDTLWFVALADIHHFYDELFNATEKINSLKNISFVVVCGDITDAGLAKEFEFYKQVMENLDVPFITIIGNHDYRSNGSVIYRKMFGPANFKFEVGLYHFIGFDDVVWENNNSFPDFEWLNSKLVDSASTMESVFAHIPPWTDQLDLDTSKLREIIINKPDHILIVHGHEHGPTYRTMNALHIVTGCINDKELCLIGLYGSSYTLKRLSF